MSHSLVCTVTRPTSRSDSHAAYVTGTSPSQPWRSIPVSTELVIGCRNGASTAFTALSSATTAATVSASSGVNRRMSMTRGCSRRTLRREGFSGAGGHLCAGNTPVCRNRTDFKPLSGQPATATCRTFRAVRSLVGPCHSGGALCWWDAESCPPPARSFDTTRGQERGTHDPRFPGAARPGARAPDDVATEQPRGEARTPSSALGPGTTFPFVVNEAFAYKCAIHPSMTAEVRLSG